MWQILPRMVFWSGVAQLWALTGTTHGHMVTSVTLVSIASLYGQEEKEKWKKTQILSLSNINSGGSVSSWERSLPSQIWDGEYVNISCQDKLGIHQQHRLLHLHSEYVFLLCANAYMHTFYFRLLSPLGYQYLPSTVWYHYQCRAVHFVFAINSWNPIPSLYYRLVRVPILKAHTPTFLNH